MIETTRDVIVIGGGISGLAAAWYVKRRGLDVCLFEAEDGVGGCTRTAARDGFLLEKGPFNVIVRDPAFEEILAEFSGKVKVVSASRAARARFIYRKGRLWKVPTNPVALAATGLLGFSGKLRLLAGLLRSKPAGEKEETIEQVAVRRFGREVADTLVSAVVAGIFAGDIKRLSLPACFPGVAPIDREVRSLLAYGLGAPIRAKRNPNKHKRRWRGLVSLEGGLGALTAAIGDELGDDLARACRIESIRSDDGEFEVTYEHHTDPPRRLRSRQLVIASPASEAARLLVLMAPDAAALLKTVASASLAVLNLGFKSADIGHPLEGFGFLVPDGEPGFPLMGVLWADSIFPHHAPADHRLIRVFIGGSRDPDAVSRSDSDLVNTAVDSLRGLLDISGAPVLVDFCRYRAAVPQYYLGHREMVGRIRESVAAQPGLHLVGNYLEGVSLNDCVRLAKRVAGEVGAFSQERGTLTVTEAPTLR